MDARYGRVVWGPKGTRSRTKTWGDPLKWNREAERAGVKHKVFCASLADVFEDFAGVIQDSKGRPLWRDRQGRYNESEASGFEPYEIATLDLLRADLFRLIDHCQNLHWLLLTKRPENILEMWPDNRHRANVWLGTSIANQKNADEWIDRLVKNRRLAPVLFLSLEPQIGYVDLAPWLTPFPVVDWVIIGGESKQGPEEPRPFQIKWAKDAVDQCGAAGVPCFVKQLGSNVWDRNRRLTLKDSHGGDTAEWPEAIRVRECPEHFALA